MKITIRQRSRVWWLDQMVQGKRYRAPIGEGSRAWALSKAPALLAELMNAGDRQPKSDLRVRDLERHWDKFCEQRSGVEDKTRKSNFGALKLVFGPDTFLRDLVPEMVEDWYERKLATAEDEVDEDRKKRSGVSMWNQAKSVLQVRALDFYRRKRGVEVPDAADRVAKFRLPRPPAWSYRLPPRELIARTEAEAAKLEGDLRMIYRLAMFAGLRAKEMLHLRGDWLEVDQGVSVIGVVTRPGFRPKGTERWVPVPESLAVDVRSAGNDFVIGNDLSWTDRDELISRVFADWMRSIGWDRKRYSKAAHELRKLYGCRIYNDPKLGPHVAQKNLGHASLETTCRYYADTDAPLGVLEES